MSGDSETIGPRIRPAATRWIAGICCLAAFCILIGLGTWQVQRLQWKEGLLATIDERVHSAPVAIADLPSDSAPGALEYTPVTVRGTFLHDEEMFFFATHKGQSGWYVYTPLRLAAGQDVAPGTVIIVNRGFVPYELRDASTRPGSQPAGEIVVTGLVREILKEKPGALLPDNEPDERTFFWKDWAEMVHIADLEPASTLQLFVDTGSGASGKRQLPVGGVTQIDLPNNHLQYVITWYGLAAALAGVVGVWVYRSRQARRATPRS